MTMHWTDVEQRGRVLDVDLACDGCQYNLRGLRGDGRCPECGLDVEVSIEREARKRQQWRLGQHPPDPGVVRQWIEGLACIIASFALAVFATLAPDSMQEFRSRGRVALLCIAVTGWTLNWFGIWKTGRRDRSVDPPDGSGGNGFVGVALCIYVFYPTVIFSVLMLPCLLSSIVITIAFHVRMRRLAMLCNTRWLAAQCAIMGVIMSVGVLLSVMLLNDTVNGLDILLRLPAPTYGSAFVPAMMARATPGELATPWVLMALVPVWDLVVLATLMLRLRPLAGRGVVRSASPPAPPGRR